MTPSEQSPWVPRVFVPMGADGRNVWINILDGHGPGQPPSLGLHPCLPGSASHIFQPHSYVMSMPAKSLQLCPALFQPHGL